MIGLYYLLPLFCFIPGALLVYSIAIKRHINISCIEALVLGAVIWNYLLIGLGYIVGIFTNYLNEFFICFTILSVFVSALSSFFIFKQNISLSLRFDRENLPFLIIIIALISFIATLIFTHSIFAEFDSLFLYLPRTKSILLTGGLQYDFYLQSSLVTISQPGLPLIYSWLGSFGMSTTIFDMSVRVFPVIYVILTCFVIFLSAKELTQNYKAAYIAVVCFLSLPVVLVMATNYSLYLDIAFVFLLSSIFYLIIKFYKTIERPVFWLIALGITFATILLEKDVSELLILPLFTLCIIPFLTTAGKKIRILLAIILTIFFVSVYNFYTVWDLFHYPLSLISGYAIKQAPVIVVGILFGVLVYKSLPNIKTVKKRKFLLFCIPFVPVISYWLRNYFLFGVPSKLLIYLNPRIAAVESLKIVSTSGESSPGGLSSLPANVWGMFRFDVIFTHTSLAAILLIPCVIGICAVVYYFAKDKSKSAFVLLSLSLLIFCLWSWAFNSSYTTSDIRRLYYFTPFIGLFAAIGIFEFSKLSGTFKTLVPRFTLFSVLSLVYLWFFKFGFNTLTIDGIRSELLKLTLADFDLLVVFAFFFIISFFPFSPKIPIHRIWSKLGKRSNIIPCILAIVLLLSSLTTSLMGLSNTSENIYQVNSTWENNLPEVISYINSNLQDNYTIITCYALPLAYATSHPIIEVTNLYGLVTLQSIDSKNMTDLLNNLLGNNIRYLLFPKSTNSHYATFIDTGTNLNIVNLNFLCQSPYIVRLTEFTKYDLYKVVNSTEYTYDYLTNFENWTSLNQNTNIASANGGILIQNIENKVTQIFSNNDNSFWNGATASSADVIQLSQDSKININGDSYLKIQLNGTQNMVIRHRYGYSQNWSCFDNIAFPFYGANTGKSVTITFHTSSWNDYYTTYITDNFVGWKNMSLALNQFSIVGNPSWSNVTYTEILMGSRVATYYLGDIILEGYTTGVSGTLLPIYTENAKLRLAVSVTGQNLTLPAKIKLISSHGQLIQGLYDGINYIDVGSELLKGTAIITVYFPQTDAHQSLNLYYLSITS